MSGEGRLEQPSGEAIDVSAWDAQSLRIGHWNGEKICAMHWSASGTTVCSTTPSSLLHKNDAAKDVDRRQERGYSSFDGPPRHETLNIAKT